MDFLQGSDSYFQIDTADSSEALNFGNATTNPTFNFLGTGKLSIAGDVDISGALNVTGGAFSTQLENVITEDNFLDMNHGYTTAAGQAGGFAVDYLPTATTDTVSALGSGTTATTGTGGVFAAGDIVMYHSATHQLNHGYYEVVSHVGTALTISGSPTHPFCTSRS